MEWLEKKNRVSRAALALARQAVAHRPDNAVARLTLAEALLDSEEIPSSAVRAGALAVLAPVRSVSPPPALRLRMAAVARRLDDHETALMMSEAALADDPADPAAQAERFLAAVAAGADDIADALIDVLLARRPVNARALRNLMRRLLVNERFDDAICYGQAAVDAAPWNAEAVYYLAIALAKAGKIGQSQDLMDFDRFTRRIFLAAPDEYPDRAAFNTALADEILRNPTLTGASRGDTTLDGLETGDLTQPGDTAIPRLLAAMRSAVAAYAAAPAADDGHPFVGHPFVKGVPQRASDAPWAVVYPENGRQKTHIHNNAWMVAVYYVDTPTADDGDDGRGSLVLGLGPDSTLFETSPWGERRLTPQAGELILFPAWIPHYSTPTGISGRRRICVPMNVRRRG